MNRRRVVGVVREVYSKWERRSPLCPWHVGQLVKSGIDVVVQPSTRRVFPDDEYRAVGARVSNDLSDASVIMGVKQVPVEDLLADKTYLFFSHTKKAQPENMELLDEILKKNITLLDYECITKNGVKGAPRVIAFGRYAGLAGMIDALHGLGKRLLTFGHSTPFLNVAPCFSYPSLDHASTAVKEVGQALRSSSVIEEFAPMVFTFTGDGKVAQGAREIFHMLPHEMVSPKELPALMEEVKRAAPGSASRRVLYGCNAMQEDMVQPKDGGAWDRTAYYENPHLFEPIFHRTVAPYTSVLVNCMYWEQRFPRLLTLEQTEELARSGKLRLLLDADLTCDVRGSIEFLTKSTYIENPFFVYNPLTRESHTDLDADGVMMLGVDILPSELPREASQHFGDILTPYVPLMVDHSASRPFTELPPELAMACIAANGELTPNFKYIASMRKASGEHRHKLGESESASSPKKTVMLRGHLFDSGLINQAFDLLEAANVDFSVDEIDVVPNTASHQVQSSVVLTVQAATAGALADAVDRLQQLCTIVPRANASLVELTSPHEARQPSAKETPTYSATSRVLVLGAGLVSAPLIQYLAVKCSRAVTVVGAVDAELDRVRARFPDVKAVKIDVASNPDAVSNLVSETDVVVSLLPAAMHHDVAQMCLGHNKHLVTASYVDARMKSLHDQAKAKGLVFLNEMGLDPGMDHMSAMRAIHAFQNTGGRVVGFSSVCGGLPAPEAADNPLRYKFSWSPRGVLTASKNAALYKRDGKEVAVKGEDLLSNAENIEVIPSLNLECLPNRNSLPYGEVYGIQDTARSVFRGTLRYSGFSGILHGIRLLGLLDDTPVDFLAPAAAEVMWCDVLAREGIPDVEAVLSRLAAKGHPEKASRDTVECMRWLGLFDKTPVTKRASNKMDSLCALLEKKLSFAPGERDMALMQHIFDVEWNDGRKERHTSTFLAYGDQHGDTAMAKTVGLTAAIGAELVIQHSVKERGVVVPTTPDVYEPALAMLKAEGFDFVERRV